MKTQSMEWSPTLPATSTKPSTASAAGAAVRQLAGLTRYAARALVALAAAGALVILATWAVMQPQLAPYLQAVLWSLGFVFAALALEADAPQTALLQLATAVALPLLAFISSRVAPEVAIVAATLLAAWVVAAILRR